RELLLVDLALGGLELSLALHPGFVDQAHFQRARAGIQNEYTQLLSKARSSFLCRAGLARGRACTGGGGSSDPPSTDVRALPWTRATARGRLHPSPGEIGRGR